MGEASNKLVGRCEFGWYNMRVTNSSPNLTIDLTSICFPISKQRGNFLLRFVGLKASQFDSKPLHWPYETVQRRNSGNGVSHGVSLSKKKPEG